MGQLFRLSARNSYHLVILLELNILQPTSNITKLLNWGLIFVVRKDRLLNTTIVIYIWRMDVKVFDGLSAQF